MHRILILLTYSLWIMNKTNENRLCIIYIFNFCCVIHWFLSSYFVISNQFFSLFLRVENKNCIDVYRWHRTNLAHMWMSYQIWVFQWKMTETWVISNHFVEYKNIEKNDDKLYRFNLPIERFTAKQPFVVIIFYRNSSIWISVWKSGR